MLDAQKADSNRKAKIAEAAVLLRLVVNGFNVYSSIFDGERVDMVAEAAGGGGLLLRVQVKYARRPKHGRPGAGLHRTYGHGKQKRYEAGAFDVLVAYDLYTDTACVWLASEVEQHSAWVSMTQEAEERWDKLRL